MKLLLTSAFALAAMLAVPGSAFAAMYAYVNQAGEVRTTEASNPTSAITTAPGIHVHSGVMLLTNPNDGIIGDNVSGT